MRRATALAVPVRNSSHFSAIYILNEMCAVAENR